MNKSKFLKKYGTWAVVTGASDGLGKQFAMQLAEIGFNLVLVARRKNLLDDLSERLNATYKVDCISIDLDLSANDAVASLYEKTSHLGIGLIVAAAGFGTSANLIEADIKLEKQLIDLNCRCLMEMSHVYGKKFTAQKKGGMILISSLLGFHGAFGTANYAASKAYVQALGEGLYFELRKHNVDVLTVAPGPINTGFAEAAGMNFMLALKPEEVAKESLASLGRQITLLPGFLTKFLYLSLFILLFRNLKVMVMGMVMKTMIKKKSSTPRK
jgi:short-subunit dehydrogenase